MSSDLPPPSEESPNAESDSLTPISSAESNPPSDPVPESVASEVPPSASTEGIWEQVRPALKTQSIKVLRGTIQVLEGVVAKLEAEPTAKVSGATDDSTIARWLGKVQPLWQALQPWWMKLLGLVRSRLPDSANQKLSDPALSGAIVGILLLLLWIPSALSPTKKPTPVAVVPPSQRLIPKATPTPLYPPPAAAPLPSPSPSIAPAPLPAASPELPPKPKPSPVLNLTPEQKLIARIQDQVAQVSDQYANGLIESVQANFKGSLLIVRVSDGWNALSSTQQDKLAAEMLRRSKILDFSKLEITNPDGMLLARSPVVGDEMIIIQRNTEEPQMG
jgi:hypothetical protein